MTPVDQEFLSDKEKGIVGDCVRASTASVLNLPLSAVPHFVALYDHDWCSHWEDWLEARGIVPIRFAAGGNPSVIVSPDVYHLAAGPGVRGPRHMVVRRGSELAHDPHPSRAGLLEVDSVWVLVPQDIGALMKPNVKPNAKPGMNWELSEATKKQLADIDSHLGRGPR